MVKSIVSRRGKPAEQTREPKMISQNTNAATETAAALVSAKTAYAIARNAAYAAARDAADANAAAYAAARDAYGAARDAALIAARNAAAK